MSTPLTNQPPPEQPADKPDEPEYADHWIQLRDRLAADGVHIQIPRIDARHDLPKPIEVESEILARWRDAPP